MGEKDEKRVFEEKRYAILTKESIKLIAEAAGYSDLPDDAAGLLGEDVTYRLREVTQSSTQYLKHGKRKRLTTEDFNKSLKRIDVQTIHGYSSPDPLQFRQVKDGDIFFVEDTDVSFSSIASNGFIPKNSGDTTIKAHWLAVEGVSKVTTNSQQSQAKSNVKHEITEELQQYYENITNAILSADEEAMKVALNDLRSNPQIVPLLPYFVNFVSNGVKTVSHDVSQLTKLLHTVKSLIHNTSLYLEPQPYLNLLVQGVSYCLLEPLAASINPTNDHWSLRDYAARLLAQIVECWSSPINHLLYNTIKTIKEVLHDHTKPFCCHYGAVVGLNALGVKALEDILIPHLPSYWPHMTAIMEDTSFANMVPKADTHKVYGAILLAVEYLLKTHIKMFEDEYLNDDEQKIGTVESKIDSKVSKQIEVQVKSEVTGDQSTNLQNISHPTIGQFYSEMYQYFGDSLSIRLPDLNEKVCLKNKVFKPKKKEIYVTLSDPEAAKSGDDLLEEFMEQVRIQEQIDKERKEQEKIEQERLERERKKKEEEERVRREEEERLERIRQAKLEKERQLQHEEEKRLEKMRKEEFERERKRKVEEEQERERQMIEIQKKIEEEKQRKLLLQEERKRKALEKQKKAEEERRRKMLEKQRKLEEELEVEREKERQRERLMLERQREKERLQQEEFEKERLRKIEEIKERHVLEERERELQILENQRMIFEEKQRQEALERQLALERQKQQELKLRGHLESPKRGKYELHESMSHFRHHDLKINLDQRQLSDFRERQQYMEEDDDEDDDITPIELGHCSDMKKEETNIIQDDIESLPGPSLRQTEERIKRKSGVDDIYYESSDSDPKSDSDFVGDKTTHMDLAVKRISDKGSIKLKITRRPKVMLQKRPKESLKEVKTVKKKKQSLKMTKPYDAFEFESDPEDYKPGKTFGKMQYYSSEGESSDGTGQRKPLTLKLKVKDSKEFASE